MSGMNLSLEFPDEVIERIAVRVVELTGQSTEREPWLNAEQAAEYLSCPVSRVHELKEQGKIKVYRDGRRLLFKTCDLDAYVEGQG